MTALVAAVELIFEADADVAAQRWDADDLLIGVVEEIRGVDVELQAAAYGVAAGDVEAGVARVAVETQIRGSRCPCVGPLK